MRTKIQIRAFSEVLDSLRSFQFDVRDVAGVAGQVFVGKYGAGAILAPNPKRLPDPTRPSEPAHSALWVERPGFVLNGLVATLLDRGYQKFWKTPSLEIVATSDSLRSVHRFSEELREAIGEPSLYNESLGTTSDLYRYDRLKGRDLPLAQRPVRPWETENAG